MSYTRLKYDDIKDARLKQVFLHANNYLADVYGMFRTLPPADNDGGGGNFGIALILLCVIDGLATEVWPGRAKTKDRWLKRLFRRILSLGPSGGISDQEKRFKRLVRDKLYWGPEGKNGWVHKGTAAAQLYAEIRNPLVHELAKDKRARSRPSGYVEPVIAKWEPVSSDMREIAKIDALNHWNDEWPILSESKDRNGKPRFRLSVPALYWAVKKLANDMLADEIAKGT